MSVVVTLILMKFSVSGEMVGTVNPVRPMPVSMTVVPPSTTVKFPFARVTVAAVAVPVVKAVE